MAGPTLDDIFYSEVDKKVKDEINRRKGIYSKGIQGSTSALADEEYRWLYRKTAYLTLRRLNDSETTVIYDINFGKPKMDIVYNDTPVGSSDTDTRFRKENAIIGRDVTVTSGSNTTTTGYSTMLGPTTAPLLDLYTTDKGFIATTLVDATIETIGEGLAYTTKFSVKFTIHDRDKVSYYLERIMRPLTPIELGFGWSTEDNDPNRGFLRGTVTNFSFSANNDGSWNCMIEGYSNPSLIEGIPLTSIQQKTYLTTVTGKRTDTIPIYADNTYVRTVPQTQIDFVKRTANLININGGLGSVLSNLIDNTQVIFDNSKVSLDRPNNYVYLKLNRSNISTVTGYYVVDMPLDQYVTPWGYSMYSSYLGLIDSEFDNPPEESHKKRYDKDVKTPARVPRMYIRLDALIHLINCILAYNLRVQPDMPIRVVIDQDVSYFTGCDPVIMRTGPADFLKFAFPDSIIGSNSDASFAMFDDFQLPNNLYYIGAILLNAEYVLAEFVAAATNYKQDDPNKNIKTFTSFLNNLLKQLDIETGGMIQATCFPTDTEIIIKDLNSIKASPKKSDPVVELTAFTKNSICREVSVESDVSSEMITVAAITSNTYTSIGRAQTRSSMILNKDGKPLTLVEWKSLTESERNEISNETNLNIEAIDANLKEKYINDVDIILSLIKNLNLSHSGFLGVPGQTSNLEKNQSGEFLDAFLEEPYPTSHYAYVMRVQELYRLIFQKAKQAVLEGDNSLWSRLFNLKTAMFPIKLKIKLDGIHGFKQGNSITTNWLPTGYSNKNCYFTILRISHTISNNDWYTELEAIYRIIL